jgi:hypothetical protein
MRIGNEGMTYVTKSGSFFIKSSPDHPFRKRPRRFTKLQKHWEDGRVSLRAHRTSQGLSARNTKTAFRCET